VSRKKEPAAAAPARRREAAAAPGATNGATAHAIYALVPALAALIAYWRALGNDFVWDDPLVLQQLRAIRGAGDLFVLPAGIPRFYYRPVVFATYLIDRGLGGEQPFWFHASVVAWHVLNTVLVYLLALRLFGGRLTADGRPDIVDVRLFACIAALFFAVDPIHVESVAWMAGRSDVIACSFVLTSLLLFLGESTATAWGGGATFLLALLTKEPVVLAAAVFPLADWSLGRKFRAARYPPLLVAVAVYLALRVAGAGLLGETTQPSSNGIGAVIAAIGYYLGRAFLPIGQTVFAATVPTGALYTITGIGGMIVLGALFAWSWRARAAAPLVALAWFAATLAPALGLVLRRIGTTPVAERYLYVPSVGVVILAAWLLSRLAQRRAAVLPVAAVLALAGIVETARRNHVWENDLHFWAAAAASTNEATPQRELADALLRRGQTDEAEAAYLAALQRPGSEEERAMGYGNLANLYSRGPRVDEAIDLFRKAVELRPHPTLYHGLGLALMRKAERAQAANDQATVQSSVVAARAAFERALALGSMPNPPSAFMQWQPAKTHVLLGQVLVALNERELARQHLELVLQLEPTGLTADTARKYLAMVSPPAS